MTRNIYQKHEEYSVICIRIGPKLHKLLVKVANDREIPVSRLVVKILLEIFPEGKEKT